MNKTPHTFDNIHSAIKSGPGGASTTSNAQVFDAYTASLMDRFNLTEPAAIAHQLTALASALGPSVKIRDPFGQELTLAFEFAHCAAAPAYAAGVALGTCMAWLKAWTGTLTLLRETTGHHKVNAYNAELLSEIALLERELAKLPAQRPQPHYGFYTPDPAQLAREREEERRKFIEAIKVKRQQASEIQTQLRPIVLIENPPWSAIRNVDQLSFDKGVTVTSCDGLAFESLIALTGNRLNSIGGLFNASRYGRHCLDTSGEFSIPVLNCAFILGYPALSQALRKKRLLQFGTLDGFLFFETIEKPCVEFVVPPTDNEVDKQWGALTERLFHDFRVPSSDRVFEMDQEAQEMFQQFRTWSQGERCSGELLRRFARTWPSTLLRIGLVYQIVSGTGSGNVVGARAIERAVGVMKAMCEQHARLVERFAKVAPPEDAVDRMVAKVAAFGRMTRRELFRRYNKQQYDKLHFILKLAVAQGRLSFNGKDVCLVNTDADPPSKSVSGSGSAQ